MAVPAIFTDRRLAALSAGNFVVGTSLHIVSGLLNQLASAFQVSIAKAGFLIAAFAITSVIAAPLFATLGSRFDRRLVLTLALVVCALANGAAFFAQTYEQLLVTRLFAAITSAVFTPQAAAVVSRLVPDHQRSQAISAIMLGWGMASVLGIPLGVWIGHALGWRTAFGLIGLVSLAAAAGVWLLLPRGLSVAPVNLASWLAVLRTPALLLLIGTSTIFAAGIHTVFSYYAPMIGALHAEDGHRVLSGLLVVHGIASVVSNLVAIMWMERLGLEKISRLWGLLPILTFLVWPLAADGVIVLFVLQLFWSIGAAGFNSLQQARLVEVAPVLASASVALNSSAFYLGQSGGSLLGGAVWDVVGPRYLPWVGMLLLIVAMLISRKGRHAAKKLRLESITPAP
ncbi:MAG: MFS transporter [Panacagrimonas sp.]